MQIILRYISYVLLLPCLLWADGNRKQFRLQSPDSTGITFFNRLIETEDFNYARQFFVYLGGGVAVGDVNGDKLPDLFFTGMQVPNALYINKGNWKFENVSKVAGFPDTAAICFTPSFIDIDGDNDLDLYVCRFNEPNHLYINDGTGTFTEKAKEMGLAFEGKSVQAVFFDYDHDNDLDCYIAQNGFTAGGYAQIDGYSDKLFRNDAGYFVDVSKQAGIEDDRYALSVSLGDINNDGWTDIFVANDFEARDLLYVNNKNGTFTDIAPTKLRHTSHFSMGSDIADINNDGWMDILSVDMMPHEHERRMTQMTIPKVFSPYFDSTSMTRNVLQLNCGDLNFCDIGYLSGIAETDWSWSSWIADLDNDGLQDMCIVNGINRDAIDMDLASYAVKKKTDKFMWLINSMPKTRLRNYMFRNKGNLQFQDISDAWGFSEKLSTNGAIYADLDNDGDLDVLLNNIDSTMAVYRNYVTENKSGSYVKIALKGPGKNTKGLGAKIEVIAKDGKGKETRHFREMHVNRGFLSCTEPIIHVGLGSAVAIKEINVFWPGNIKQTIQKAQINTQLNIEYVAGKESTQVNRTKPLFEFLKPETSLNYVHKENQFDDFYQQRLLPHRLSINGPAIAAGDVNGDGLTDLVIGGSHEGKTMLFLRNTNGTFSEKPQSAFATDSRCEDQGIMLFDSDSDGDLDCYVASGGNEFVQEDRELFQDRLYINDGLGNFIKAGHSFSPPLDTIASSCIVGGDIDGDGDIDLFVGGRNVPGQYPEIPQSVILRNDVTSLVDITKEKAPELEKIGMITSALWSDADNDDDLDLWVVGEWMAPRLFVNNNGYLAESTIAKTELEGLSGQYHSIAAADIDNDGDMDYVLGNLGKNTRYKPTRQEPIELYAKDFDENGSVDLIMTYFNFGKKYPVRMRAPLYAQIPTLTRRFQTYHQYGSATFEDIFGSDLMGTKQFKAYDYETMWLENRGGEHFVKHALPIETQFSPVYGILCEDFNADGAMDIMTIGNFNGPDPEMFRYDNSLGCVMLGNGAGEFTALPLLQSGIVVPKDGRSIVIMKHDQQSCDIIMGVNSQAAQTYRLTLPKGATIQNAKQGTSLMVQLKNGKKQKKEFPFGSGYYSQSPGIFILPKDAKVLQK